jgi:hypothetical protein
VTDSLYRSIKSLWNLLYHFFLSSVDSYIGLYFTSIATGIVYVAGLSYVNIRAEKQERPMRVAVCHAWKMIGIAVVLTIYVYLLDNVGQVVENTLRNFYQIFGYIIIGSNLIFIFLLVINEIRQRQGLLYNYRDCLDHDNAIANNYCKLFSKNEVIIERNPTVSAAGLWKSTENLLPRNKKNYTSLWTIYMMLPKLHGALMFHYLLVTFTMNASFSAESYIKDLFALSIVIWIMVLGTIVGIFTLRFIQGAKVYTVTSIIAVIALGVSYVFYRNESQSIVIFLWIFYLSSSVVLSVPDVHLMEISKIRFSEGALAIGCFIEIVTIAVLQYLEREAYLLNQFNWYTDKYYLPTIISTIVILVVTSMIYQLHMPNTFNKSLLQIQNELLKFKKYFAFDFDNEVSSAVPRSSESNHYLVNNNVNVFEDHAKNMTNSQMNSPPNDYSEVMEPLPDPPVNKVTNFDYNTDIPKPPAIIPRVNIAKSKQNLYSNNN